MPDRSSAFARTLTMRFAARLRYRRDFDDPVWWRLRAQTSTLARWGDLCLRSSL